ncbi:MAG: TMEM175 family protein [Ferruginibacter sp.]
MSKHFFIPTNRLEAFSDGVFAIVITLIAFQFRVPKFTDEATLQQNWRELLHSASNVIAFAFSFAFISVFWMNHHQLYHSIKEVNNKLLWLNLHLLFWITMLPFPIIMVGDHPYVPMAAMSLGVVLMMCSLAAFLVRRYSHFKAKLADETLTRDSINDGLSKNIIAIVLNIIAILSAPISVYIAYGIYLVVLSLFIIPQKLERKVKRTSAPSTSQ